MASPSSSAGSTDPSLLQHWVHQYLQITEALKAMKDETKTPKVDPMYVQHAFAKQMQVMEREINRYPQRHQKLVLSNK